MLDRLDKLEAEGLEAITAADSDALESLRVAYLGKQGHVAQILRTLGQLPKESARHWGRERTGSRDAWLRPSPSGSKASPLQRSMPNWQNA